MVSQKRRITHIWGLAMLMLLMSACQQRLPQLTPSEEYVEAIIQDISGLPRDGSICLLEGGSPYTFLEASRFRGNASLQGDWLIIVDGWLGYGSDWEIFRIDLQDGSVLQLTDNDYDEFGPRLSPDGNWILFEDARNQTGLFNPQRVNGLYIIRTDGTGMTRVTDYNVYREVSWSPTSDAFAAARGGSLLQDDLDINTPPVVLFEDDAINPNTMLAWSPDGDTIAFTRSLFSRLGIAAQFPNTSIAEIVLFDVETGTTTPISSVYGTIQEIGWSLDSTTIIFKTRFEGSPGQFTYQVREDGSGYQAVQPCAEQQER